MDEDQVLAEVLDHLYEMMPSLPNLVLFTRKLNLVRGKEDNLENTVQAALSTFTMLATMPLETLEERHTSLDEASIELVEDDAPLLQKRVADVQRQLARINELDQQLNKGYDRLESALERNESAIKLAETKQGHQESEVSFEGLFSGPGTTIELPGREELFAGRALAETVPFPPPLTRQQAIPPGLEAS